MKKRTKNKYLKSLQSLEIVGNLNEHKQQIVPTIKSTLITNYCATWNESPSVHINRLLLELKKKKGRKNIKTFHVGNFENYSVAIAMRGTSQISLMQREKFFERRNEACKGSPKKKKGKE